MSLVLLKVQGVFPGHCCLGGRIWVSVKHLETILIPTDVITLTKDELNWETSKRRDVVFCA